MVVCGAAREVSWFIKGQTQARVCMSVDSLMVQITGRIPKSELKTSLSRLPHYPGWERRQDEYGAARRKTQTARDPEPLLTLACMVRA